MKVGIIGTGNVGRALGAGLTRSGYQVKFGHRDPKEPILDAVEWGEVVILAVPYSVVKDVSTVIRSAVVGKAVIDVTNAVGANMELAIGFTTSAAEELQKLLPKAHVVKAFNTVFAQNQDTGKIGKEQLSAFIAGNNLKAKKIVMQLAKDIGFDPVDAWTLKTARYLEPMAMLNITLGYGQKMGTKIGFKLIKG